MMQSCVIYKKTPVPLVDAVDQGKVMVITDSGQGYEFRNILKTSDEIYLGVNKSDTINLNNKLITEVYLKDKTKSTLATIGVAYLPTLLVLGVINNLTGLLDN